MALFHAATITPTKAELVAAFVPSRSWGPDAASPVESVGAFRFDDPAGAVGIEIHLVRAGDTLFQVPTTYREAPLAGAEAALITEMQHSVLGTRWVYDAVHDPVFVTMLAAVTMTGQGEALGMVEYEGRWVIAPSPVRIHGGGWTTERVPVDRFELLDDDAAGTRWRNERFEMTLFRRPTAGQRPPIALTATWPGQAEPVVLTAVREHGGT